ncbi:MAG: very short patch repair endonuclease [Gemmatimonadaceae bacterium]|nr:very short patch repair endonuclease [Gemmatimonadaceae bacterium]
MKAQRPIPSPMDRHRSRTLSAVRSTGNRSTELRMVGILRELGLSGWRRHLPLAGRPDFAWRRERVALFVDGCFWHGCPRCYSAPKHNGSFWARKLEENTVRDRRADTDLRRAGWRVVRVWECRVDSSSTRQRLLKVLRR